MQALKMLVKENIYVFLTERSVYKKLWNMRVFFIVCVFLRDTKSFVKQLPQVENIYFSNYTLKHMTKIKVSVCR